MQFQLEWTEQNKKAYHVDLSEEFQAKPQRKQWMLSNLESTEGMAES